MNNKNNTGQHFIFVGGCPRSGTTLVQNMLDSHPLICGLPEFNHLTDFIDLRNKMRTSIQKELINLICSEKQLNDNIRFFIEQFLNPFLREGECQFVSEKSPRNILIFKELIELYPASKCICVVRDPRAVVASLFEVRKKAEQQRRIPPPVTMGVRSAIDFVRECLQKGWDVQNIFPNNVLTVCYETLVNSPESETQKICSFLGINWTEKMLYPAHVHHMGENAITSVEHSIYYDKKMYQRNPDKASLEKWKKSLSFCDQIRITDAFRKFEPLQQFQYDFSLKHIPFYDFQKSTFINFFRKKLGDYHLRIKSILRKI